MLHGFIAVLCWLERRLAAQLKALYVKQEFSRFAQETQDLPASQLKQAYKAFMQRIKPRDVDEPTWKAGIKHADL
jgi:hypothetical protein